MILKYKKIIIISISTVVLTFLALGLFFAININSRSLIESYYIERTPNFDELIVNLFSKNFLFPKNVYSNNQVTISSGNIEVKK